MKKEFVGRRPRSTYTFTAKGCTAMQTYLNAMQELINAVVRGEKDQMR